jgi:hypothetical protein
MPDGEIGVLPKLRSASRVNQVERFDAACGGKVCVVRREAGGFGDA